MGLFFVFTFYVGTCLCGAALLQGPILYNVFSGDHPHRAGAVGQVSAVFRYELFETENIK
jgi:hypothetical protein